MYNFAHVFHKFVINVQKKCKKTKTVPQNIEKTKQVKKEFLNLILPAKTCRCQPTV